MKVINMYDKLDELDEIEISKEDLEGLDAEELVDLKVELEELIMDCDEILDIGNEEDE